VRLVAPAADDDDEEEEEADEADDTAVAAAVRLLVRVAIYPFVTVKRGRIFWRALFNPRTRKHTEKDAAPSTTNPGQGGQRRVRGEGGSGGR